MMMYWINIIKFEARFQTHLNIQFYSMPVCDEKYLKAKVRG